MKKIATILVLVFGLVGLATAQHRGGHRGSYNNHDGHNGYSGYQHGGQRHGGGYNWVAPLFIGAGATYLLTRPYYVEPVPVYYEPLPRIVTPLPRSAPEPATSACYRETRKIFDEKAQPLGTQEFLVCPIVSSTSAATVTR